VSGLRAALLWLAGWTALLLLPAACTEMELRHAAALCEVVEAGVKVLRACDGV
jgi:hypothetical protein